MAVTDNASCASRWHIVMEELMDTTRPTAAIYRLKGYQAGPFKFEQTGKFADYWFSLPKLGLVPHKSSIEPRRMTALLPGAIMLEINSAGRGIRVRLSGTGNSERWGFEMTNGNYLNFIPPQQHFTICQRFDQAIEHPSGLVLISNELYTSGRTRLTETVLFPMRTREPDRAILFGLITADTERDAGLSGDLLASLHYTISTAQFINIGAGIPD